MTSGTWPYIHIDHKIENFEKSYIHMPLTIKPL
jgi:hypothetical protein